VPINEAFTGAVHKLKMRLKLGKASKPATEVIDQPNINAERNNEVNLEFKQNASVQKNKDYDHIQVDFEQQKFEKC
jgi:hypothetical protein